MHVFPSRRNLNNFSPRPQTHSQVVNKFWRQYKSALAALFVLLFLWWFLLPSTRHWHSNPLPQATFRSGAASSHPHPGDQAALDFWHAFSNALDAGKPSFDEIKRTKENEPWIVFDRVHQASQRPDILDVTQEQVEELKRLRTEAIDEFQKLSESLPFVKGTRGITTTAGNDALPILTTSLWVLRAAGSTLPVEVWFYDYENWEEEPCKEIFPLFGAKCMFMIDYLPKDLEKPLHLTKYAFKTLALTFSTFEQTLFLDCDAFPVMNPDSVFDSEPFNSTGLVLWPDYWASTASKYWFEIRDEPVPDLKEMATTESGEIIINKATHGAILLLVNFYNTWGPKIWHRLLSQNAPGEGDKDTYLAAAKDFKLSWYQISEKPQRVGYRCDGKKHAVGSAQSHPLDDFRYTSNGITRHEEGLDLGESFHPRILILHGNLPKYDPAIMLDWSLPDIEWEDMLRCNNGKGQVHRMWGPRELAIPKYGWDVERAVWDAMRWEACEHERGFKIWTEGSLFRPKEKLRHDLCEKMTELWTELFPGETFSPHVPQIGVRQERPWGGWNAAPT